MIKKSVFRSFIYFLIILFFVSCQNQVGMDDFAYPPVLNNNQKEEITYTITYKNVDGLENPNPTVYSFTKDVTLQPVLKDGFGFAGWYTSSTFEPSTEITEWEAYEMSTDLVLYAKYSKEIFSIIYHNVDGLENTNPKKYNINKDVTLAPVLKENYGFEGWYTSSTFEPSTKITGWKAKDMASDLILYAKFDQEVFDITYHNVDNFNNPNSKTYNKKSDFTLSSPTRDGWEFQGWYTSSSFEPSTKITGWKAGEKKENVNLYAKTLKVVYNISYQSSISDYTNPNAETYNIKNSFTLQPASKTGYKFSGWYLNSSYTGNPVSGWDAGTYTKDLVFYAKFIEYSTFNLDELDISNLQNWLDENLDKTKSNNKLKISGNATEDDLRTISLQIKNVEKYIEEMDLSDLNVAQFYNTNWGAHREKGFMSALTNVKKIILPASLTILSEGAFAYCDNLEEIVINEGVTDILWSAFAYCHKLKEVTIPDSVVFIAQTAFYECTSLENVNISKDSNLEIIGSQAFYKCNKLTSFYFPSKITHLDCRHATRSRGTAADGRNDSGSFLQCTGLTTLTFSKNIKKINNQAFFYCNNITTINFEGTQEEWAEVQIGTDNGSLLSATVNYNYVIQ